MSRRGSQDEPGFGSDSFLDIIANLVGILIILIVLAGLRASETVELADSVTEPPHSPKPVPSLPAREETDSAQKAEEARAELEAERQRRLTAIEEASRLAALSDVARKQIVDLQTAAYRVDDSDAATALSGAQQDRDESDAALRVLIAAQQRIDDERAHATARFDRQSSELNRVAAQLDEVNRELSGLADRKPKKESLTHRVSPVGKIVAGDEVHFRISDRKISHVPIEELSGILRDKIRHNGSWLLKYNRHAGVIGPVEGYRLEYVVAREQLSVVDELRVSRGYVRIGVSEFVIRPTRDIVEASVAAALQRGGLVYRRLAALPPDTPVTLWVYPESFTAYRQVAAFARQNGFIVAGRPLPEGMPIAGSPQGSKSVAQ